MLKIWNSIDLILLLLGHLCHGVICSVIGEICIGGTCKCGTSASCLGKSTGAYCDASFNSGSGICKCSSSLVSCADPLIGLICDASGNSGAGACKCSSTETCTETQTCYNGVCVGKYAVVIIANR